ncbi:MAG: ParB/RepB/Spo0J family partition protein [Sphingomonadales bacterium]|nr:ParB/RepB/Spo0J family partition protein [Sphingomonadales bacterium]
MVGLIRDILNTLSYDPPPTIEAQDGALTRLDKRLSGLTLGTGVARNVVRIRPRECSVWDGNPRNVPGLTAANCRSLIDSIAAEGGNRIPVLIRLTPPGSALPYELLVGSRRRFSIDWLNHNGRPELFLNALVVELSDEEAFRVADIENREREDISELDRARSYEAAVGRFYAGVQSRMAEALSLSNSQLSRLLSLAQMPVEVVDSFATRDELRVRHSEVLTPLLRRDPERSRIIKAAIAIGAEQQQLAARDERMIPAATVLARLRLAASPDIAGQEQAGSIVVEGTRVGRLKHLKSGGHTVELAIAPDANIDDLLAELRHALETARHVPLSSEAA